MAVTQAQVAQLYVALFNRAPEGAGFNAWVNAGANSTIAKMANDMLSSPAALAYFNGSIDHDRDFVEMLYKNILGKDYSQDPDGINAWVKHIQLGNSRGDTVAKLFEVATSAIAKAADPVAAKVFENKTAISQYMAEKIADIPADQTGAYDYSLFQDIIATTNNTNLDEQKAKIDALIAPTIHNLSADTNDVSGTGKSDVFNGAVSATVGQTTFKATDKLDGKGGNDTLNLNLYTNFYGMTNGTGEVKNIENLNLTNKTNGDLRFDTKYIHNLETITLNGENKVDVINPENKVKLLVNDLKLSGNTDSGRLNLIYNTDVLAGSNDDQEIVVNNVNMDKDARINITTVNGDHIEALTINAVGGASKLTNFTSNTTRQPDQTASIKTMHIKGTADLTVDTTSGLYSFDATEYKGNKLIANVKANGYVQSIKGSGQDDVFNVTGASGRIIPIDGGAGKDTVNFIDAINGNQHVEMTGVEVLNINTNASVLDFTRAQEITELGINGTSATVNILNSKIAKVNAKATNSTNVTINNSTDIRDFVIEKGNSGSITANGTEKLNVKVANASDVPASQGTTFASVVSNTVKELDFTLENTTASGSTFYQDINSVFALETLNVVNKTDKDITASITALNASGSHDTNAYNLKTLNVETKGGYTINNKLSGISKINLKGTGDDTSVTLGAVGDKTYLPVPLQGVQDISLKAEGLKNLSVAANDKIYTTRDVSLISTTDKEDSTVTYGEIGDRDNDKKVNNVTVSAVGQKTLTVGNITAAGDVSLTSKFTQEGSVANYNAGTVRTTGDITINHTSNSNITDGVINFLSHAEARNFTVNASGYKELNINNSTNQRITATGDMTFNLKASVAGSIADIGHTLPFDINNAPIKAKSLTINAAADDGITDAVLKLGDYWGDMGEGGDINITAVNQKTVSLGWLRGLNSGNDNKKSDVNINLSTYIQDSDVTIGYTTSIHPYTKGIGHGISQMAKNVNLKAHGQKTFKAEAILAVKETKININGSGLDSTAEFNRISSREGITIKADNLKELKTGSIWASQGNINISTGSFGAMQYAEFNSGSNSVHMTGVNINLDISNVIEPVNSRVSQPGQHWDKALYLSASKALNIKGYVGDDVTKIYARLGAAEKNATADIVNVKGTIMGGLSISPNNKTETMTIKGGVTNPASILAIDGGVNHNSNLTVDLSYMPKLKSIDLSGYNNASGTNKIIIRSTELEISSIKGSSTKDDISIVYAANTKLKTVDAGAGDDIVVFGGNTTQTHDITVNLGEGNDTITTAALTANKKFEISGGAGNDTFNLGASTTDASAS
ncbi:beta strand repeat-containing protein, partial [Campylobacter sp.]|uniref:beta strand repeat-containing protein n=1 Tax=Campylobacter sp. TaxID=205 RepID=UPI00361885C3